MKLLLITKLLELIFKLKKSTFTYFICVVVSPFYSRYSYLNSQKKQAGNYYVMRKINPFSVQRIMFMHGVRSDISILPLFSARSAMTPSPQPSLVRREKYADVKHSDSRLGNHQQRFFAKGFIYYQQKPLWRGKLPLGNKPITFEELEVKGDGNCGFYALRLKRAEVVRILESLAKDEKVRQELMPEIRNELIGKSLGRAMTLQAKQLADTHDQLQASQAKLEDKVHHELLAVQQPNPPRGLEQLIAYLTTANDPRFNTSLNSLTQLQQKMAQHDKAIQDYCASESMYLSYVQNSLGIDAKDGGGWLGYASALLIARHKGFNLYIWQKETKSHQVTCNLYHHQPTNVVTYHLFHTARFTHFNLLVEKHYGLAGAKVPNDILLEIFCRVVAESPTEYRNLARVCKFVSKNKRLHHFAVANHNLIAIQRNIGTRSNVSPEFEARINELFRAIANKPRPLQMILLGEVVDQNHAKHPIYSSSRVLKKVAKNFYKLYADKIPALVRSATDYEPETEASHIIDYRAYLRLRASEQLAMINIQEVLHPSRQGFVTTMPVDQTQLQSVQSGRRSHTHSSWANVMTVLGIGIPASGWWFVLCTTIFFGDRSRAIMILAALGLGLLCGGAACCCAFCAHRSSNKHGAVKESSNIFRFVTPTTEENSHPLRTEATPLLAKTTSGKRYDLQDRAAAKRTPTEEISHPLLANNYTFLSSSPPFAANQPLSSNREALSGSGETRIDIEEVADPERKAASVLSAENLRI
jgi:hypothetical protein